MTDLIYLDHAATTRLRPVAAEAMARYTADTVGNASSAHAGGRSARHALESARERVAAAIGASRQELLFTSGGTEADNLAVLGRWRATGGGVAISAVEHSAVRGAAAQAAREGASLTVMGVDERGRLDRGALDEALTSGPAVVSVMWANNEIGTLQPVGEIARRCAEAGVAFHTDAVQAVGHVPVRVDSVPCALLAFTAHKLGGPTGIGALFVREGTDLSPML
ncbi:MAG TPA: aminotransferase class V-fold PLP-dependent enzyme, partial [Longimicrobiales bacterium]|nr:aminotransferase class V-fold PLP-dependent enzyme [Longimicrobiales bacterium]